MPEDPAARCTAARCTAARRSAVHARYALDEQAVLT